MVEKRIYIIHVDDIPEEESFFDLSDEKIIDIATEKGRVYSIDEFIDAWNYGSVYNPDFSYIKLLDVPTDIIGYQVIENGEVTYNMPDWWIFKTEEDARTYIKWNNPEMYEVIKVLKGEIQNPEIISFDDFIFMCAVETLTKEMIIRYDKKFYNNPYDYVLNWLRDFGVPKVRGCNIAERVLKYYEL